jgi:Phosphatidylinositol 3- and 4-kinase/Phosphoinositide 3-kinase family, accessory domain (PIK domain)/FYVE zinc finger
LSLLATCSLSVFSEASHLNKKKLEMSFLNYVYGSATTKIDNDDSPASSGDPVADVANSGEELEQDIRQVIMHVKSLVEPQRFKHFSASPTLRKHWQQFGHAPLEVNKPSFTPDIVALVQEYLRTHEDDPRFGEEPIEINWQTIPDGDLASFDTYARQPHSPLPLVQFEDQEASQEASQEVASQNELNDGQNELNDDQTTSQNELNDDQNELNDDQTTSQNKEHVAVERDVDTTIDRHPPTTTRAIVVVEMDSPLPSDGVGASEEADVALVGSLRTDQELFELIDVADFLDLQPLVKLATERVAASLRECESAADVRFLWRIVGNRSSDDLRAEASTFERYRLSSGAMLSDSVDDDENDENDDDKAMAASSAVDDDHDDGEPSLTASVVDEDGAAARRPYWQDDDAVHRCPECLQPFGLLCGKHHCRVCGRIMCVEHLASKPRKMFPSDKLVDEQKTGFFEAARKLSTLYVYDPGTIYCCHPCWQTWQADAAMSSVLRAFEVMPLEVPLLKRACAVSPRWRVAGTRVLRDRSAVQFYFPFDVLSWQERQFLWINREWVAGHSRLMVALTRAVFDDSVGGGDVVAATRRLQMESGRTRRQLGAEICALLRRRTKALPCSVLRCSPSLCSHDMSAEDAMTLLQPWMTDRGIRAFAVDALRKYASTAEFGLLLPLLTHLLRFEPYPDPSPLAALLFERAAVDHPFRHELFWHVSLVGSEGRHPSHHRYECIKQRLLVFLATECGAHAATELTECYQVCRAFDELPRRAQPEHARAALANALAPFQRCHVPLPVDPTLVVLHFDIDHVKIMDSAMQPILIPLVCQQRRSTSPTSPTSSSSPQQQQLIRRKLLYKPEDLRKDQLMLSVIRLMNLILRREEPDLDTERVTYCVVPTTFDSGFIEIVDDATTIGAIGQAGTDGQTLQNWLIAGLDDGENYLGIRERYIRTMSFWSVVSLLLGLGDRHGHNIMIKPNGALFHIDFGFILGQDPKPLMPLMRITKDMIDCLGGKGHADYERFVNYSIRIYLCLRRHAGIFFQLIQYLAAVDPPIDDCNNIDELLRGRLLKRFAPKSSRAEAISCLKTWIDQSYRRSAAHDANDYSRSIIASSRSSSSTSSKSSKTSKVEN